MKKIVLLFILIFGLLTGCQSKEISQYDGDYIYYVDEGAREIRKQPFTFGAGTTKEKVQEMVEAINEDDYGWNLTKEGQGSFIATYSIENQQLHLDFSNLYLEFEKNYEVLIRGALVANFSQIEGIDSIGFTIQGNPLKDSRGNLIGMMTKDSFIDLESREKSYVQKEYHIYFGDMNEPKLVRTLWNFHYHKNMAVEKLLVERLVQGPDNENILQLLPKETRLVSSKIQDNICYLEFNEAFLSIDGSGKEDLVVYSIVNTIIEGLDVSKVSIKVVGKDKIILSNGLDLSKPLFRNLDLILE